MVLLDIELVRLRFLAHYYGLISKRYGLELSVISFVLKVNDRLFPEPKIISNSFVHNHSCSENPND